MANEHHTGQRGIYGLTYPKPLAHATSSELGTDAEGVRALAMVEIRRRFVEAMRAEPLRAVVLTPRGYVRSVSLSVRIAEPDVAHLGPVA